MMHTASTREIKTALITGASSGIGYELAKLFGHAGYRLVLVARGEQKLNQIASEFAEQFRVETRVIAKDLSATNAAQEIYDELQRDNVAVDVLINNAGFATSGPLAETALEQTLSMMQTNMIALTLLTQLFLPQMIARHDGKILNVASTAAFQPGPLMAVYYATKAYVLSFSEAIANEVQGTGVSVTALCPGPTETGFQNRAKMQDTRIFSSARSMVMDAPSVAAIGYHALMNGKPVVITGLTNSLMAQSVRFAPRSLVTRIARRLNENVSH